MVGAVFCPKQIMNFFNISTTLVTAGHLIKEEHPTHTKNHYTIVRSELHRFKVTPITLKLGSER